MWAAIVLLVAAFAAAPVLLSHDVYSYVDYARLSVVHGLDPYVHPPAAAPADPAFGEVDWTRATSAYGPLFTLATLPLAWLPVGAAVAALKALAALSVLGTALLVARLAPARGVDPVRAAAFVALNPLVLVHVVGGAHNDGLAMLAAMLGVAAVLSRRELGGGAALAAAFAIKAPAAFAAPFALVAALRSPSRGGGRRFAAGALAALALIALAALPRLRLGLARGPRPGGREPGADEPHERADHLRAADRRRPRDRPPRSALYIWSAVRPPARLDLARRRLAARRGLGGAPACSSPPPGSCPGT